MLKNIRHADDATLMVESKEKLKSLLLRVKEGSKKADLKFNIQTTKNMESRPNTSWQIGGEKVDAVTGFIFFELQNHY